MKINRCITGLFATTLLFAPLGASASIDAVMEITDDGNYNLTTVSIAGKIYTNLTGTAVARPVFSASRTFRGVWIDGTDPVTSTNIPVLDSDIADALSGLDYHDGGMNMYNGTSFQFGRTIEETDKIFILDFGEGAGVNFQIVDSTNGPISEYGYIPYGTYGDNLLATNFPGLSILTVSGGGGYDSSIGNIQGIAFSLSDFIPFTDFSEATGIMIHSGSSLDPAVVGLAADPVSPVLPDFISDDFDTDTVSSYDWLYFETSGYCSYDISDSALHLDMGFEGYPHRCGVISAGNDFYPQDRISKITLSDIVLGGSSTNEFAFNSFYTLVGTDADGSNEFTPGDIDEGLSFLFMRGDDDTLNPNRLRVYDNTTSTTTTSSYAEYFLSGMPTNVTITIDGEAKTYEVVLDGAIFNTNGLAFCNGIFSNYCQQAELDAHVAIGIMNWGTNDVATATTLDLGSVSVIRKYPSPVLSSAVSSGLMILSWDVDNEYDVLTNSHILNDEGWFVITNGVSSPFTNAIGNDAQMFYKLREKE